MPRSVGWLERPPQLRRRGAGKHSSTLSCWSEPASRKRVKFTLSQRIVRLTSHAIFKCVALLDGRFGSEAGRLRSAGSPGGSDVSGRDVTGRGSWCWHAAVVSALVVMLASGVPAAARDVVRFKSPGLAFEQGRGAYRLGNYSFAEQALAFAAERGSLLGKHMLATLYADSNAPFTNHAKAYFLYKQIIEEHSKIVDVDDDPRAIYVGKSMTAVGRYVLRGLNKAGVGASAERAAAYFHEAATFFRDRDASFELAKLYFTGEGVEQNNKQAISRLSWLSNEGHAGAQAFLADLFWRGKGVPRDQVRALALIMRAVENAPASERIWIEETYQVIYCGIGEDLRIRLQEQVASFSQKLSTPIGSEPQETYGLAGSPSRTCSDGRELPALRREGRAASPPPHSRVAPVAGGASQFNQGNMLDIGARGTPERR